jgi:hypothetical protein
VEVVRVSDVPLAADELRDAVAAGVVQVLEAERFEPPQNTSPGPLPRPRIVDDAHIRIGRLLLADDEDAFVAALTQPLVQFPGRLRGSALRVDGADVNDPKRSRHR